MAYSRRISQQFAARKHYDENKQVYKDRARAHNAKMLKRNRRIVRLHLEQNPCVDCGESDIDVLEFDHVRGEKCDHVSNLVRRGASAERLVREIEKCEIRCANCHRKVTKKRRNEAKNQKPKKRSVRVEVSIQLDLFG